jgi:hypothetical protein
LEDDCVPSQSFFLFCEELLHEYRDDERIMIISGLNRQGEWNSSEYNYFFSKLGGIWGWATWKRAWKHYDGEMKLLDSFIEKNYFEYELGQKLGRIRKKQMLKAPKSSWAYPWGFARHINSGLACVPSKNLIRNIGFGADSTHTKGHSKDEKNKAYEMEFPIKNNSIVVADMKYDELFLSGRNFFHNFFRFFI